VRRDRAQWEKVKKGTYHNEEEWKRGSSTGIRSKNWENHKEEWKRYKLMAEEVRKVPQGGGVVKGQWHRAKEWEGEVGSVTERRRDRRIVPRDEGVRRVKWHKEEEMRSEKGTL
jgi:hypothetical protein